MKIEQKGKLESKKSKSGKDYFTAGIKVDGTWHNATFFHKDQCDTFNELEVNKDVNTIELFDEEYNGNAYKKFRFISKTEARLRELESRIEKLEGGVI